jgi:hypothetical protein
MKLTPTATSNRLIFTENLQVIPHKALFGGLDKPYDTPDGETPTSMWSDDFAKVKIGSFTFHVESGRFQFTKEGSYAWMGPEEGNDPAFSFGTCRPYYD